MFPSPDPPTGAVILDQVRSFIGRFCSMPNPAALDLVTLFAAHTHAVDQNDRLAYDTSPRLMLSSEGPGSGKSRALELVQLLAHNGQLVCDPTAPSFAQLANEQRATILVDEMDVLVGKGNAKSDLRSLFNASYKRKTAFWSRAGKPALPIFAAVAFAGMGATFRSAPVLSALRSRTLVIEMTPQTPPESYRPRTHDPLADALRAELSEWVGRNTSRIIESMPDMPEGISDRAAELAEPLIMLATIAGGHWPETARNAVREILLGQNDEPDPLPLSSRLLLDIRTVFGDASQMGTVDLVEALYALPGSPWAKVWPSPVSAPRDMAGMLEPLNVTPTRIRVDGAQVRGYLRSAFTPLWADAVTGAGVTNEPEDVSQAA